jgi:hypothetical protein
VNEASPTPERRQSPHPWEATESYDSVAWAVLVRMHHVVLVVEPAPVLDLPPAVHLALSVDYDTAGQTLVENGWRPRSWLPRSWGRIARVDVESGGGAA